MKGGVTSMKYMSRIEACLELARGSRHRRTSSKQMVPVGERQDVDTFHLWFDRDADYEN
jgi:hypothetical protein